MKTEPSQIDLVRGKLRRLHRSIRTEKAFPPPESKIFTRETPGRRKN